MTALAQAGSLVEEFRYGLDAPICLTWELTYACNLACVHCLSSSGRRDPRELSTAVYPETSIRDPFHNLSHHSNVPDNIAKLAQLNQYHVKTFAYLVQKLRDTPDGDGSLLDHSLTMYGSGMSNSNQHDHDPLPIVLAGGASGKLKGGRHIKVASKTPLSNLLLAMLEKLGAPGESFGDSTGAVDI